MTGIVKWFSSEKKFGFIIGDDGREFFIHQDDILEDPKVLLDGQHVEFKDEQGSRGFKAKSVKVVPEKEKDDELDG